MDKATTRLFIGIRPCCPSQVFFDELVRHCKTGIWHKQPDQTHWTSPCDRHLTLAFLGDTPDYVIPLIEEGLANIARTVCSATGHLFSLGPFPAQNANALAVELIGDPNLQKLHERCRQLIIDLGMAPERGSYRPHITLARRKGGFRGLVPLHLDYSMLLDNITLYKSVPVPGCRHYHRLFETLLRGIPL